MKVGTDGTMLGCWANVSRADHILDVGCGSGVLSVICAQKNGLAKIIGVDVEEGAVGDAKRNVSLLDDSWKERISIIQTRLQDFVPDQKFDLIISNPPFFENSQISPDDARNFARHTDSLHYSEILQFAKEYLSPTGKIAIVLPHENGVEAIEKAEANNLFASRICKVYPNPNKEPHRLMFELRKQKGVPQIETLTIETGIKRHDYTPEYKELGKDFYLYF